MRNARLPMRNDKKSPKAAENRVSGGYYRSGGARYAQWRDAVRDALWQLAGRAAITPTECRRKVSGMLIA